MSQEVLCAIKDGVATLTLNRPEKHNALNTAALESLRDSFEQLDRDGDVRVVVLRSEGRTFCSGLDVGEMGSDDAAGRDRQSEILIEALQRIERSRHPTIAMVQGAAVTGGCELALHCDLRVASEAARFSMTVARLGLVVPFPLAQKLVEIIGPASTRQMLFTGQPIDGKRAYEIGMVHQLVASEELEAATDALARTIADNAPLSLAGIKETIHRAVSLRETVEHGDLDDLAKRVRRSADVEEGIRAVREKRKPVFRGE